MLIKKIFVLIMMLLLPVSCSRFNIKTEISTDNSLSTLKHSGLIVRKWKSGIIRTAEVEANMNFWMAGCRLNNSIVSLLSTGEGSFDSLDGRFYQTDINGTFLALKSEGIIKLYLAKNKDKLIKIMQEQNLDNLIFYEVDDYFSPELMYIDFDSLIAVVNKNLELLYLDHSSFGEDAGDWDVNAIKKLLLDRISNRFLASMKKLNYIEMK